MEDEMNAVNEMIVYADENGMLAEVILAFHSAARAGNSVIESCEIALSEWDL